MILLFRIDLKHDVVDLPGKSFSVHEVFQQIPLSTGPKCPTSYLTQTLQRHHFEFVTIRLFCKHRRTSLWSCCSHHSSAIKYVDFWLTRLTRLTQCFLSTIRTDECRNTCCELIYMMCAHAYSCFHTVTLRAIVLCPTLLWSRDIRFDAHPLRTACFDLKMGLVWICPNALLVINESNCAAQCSSAIVMSCILFTRVLVCNTVKCARRSVWSHQVHA